MDDDTNWTGQGGGAAPGDAGGGTTPDGGAPAGAGGAGGAPGGGAAADWRAALPEELRGDPSIVKFTSMDELARSYINAQQLIGRKGIIPPGENATPEEWNSFYEALGRPKSKDEYSLEAAGLPEGVSLNEAVLAGFKGKAHELGLTAKQAKELFGWYSGQVGDMVRSQQAARENAPKEFQAFLAREYGLENSKAAMQQAGAALRAFADDDVLQGIDKAGLNNAPWFFKLMNRIGAKFDEGGIRTGGTPSFAPSPSAAKNEVATILSNQSDAYWDPSNPEHQARVEHVMRLQKLISDAEG